MEYLSEVPGETPTGDGTEAPCRENDLLSDAPPGLKSDDQAVTCNICGDSSCPRRKGEPRAKCIHYREENKEPESEG